MSGGEQHSDGAGDLGGLAGGFEAAGVTVDEEGDDRVAVLVGSEQDGAAGIEVDALAAARAGLLS